jgi:hypothetical protein
VSKNRLGTQTQSPLPVRTSNYEHQTLESSTGPNYEHQTLESSIGPNYEH